MNRWINAVKQRGKVIDLSTLEIDEDVFWIVKTKEPRYRRFPEWALVIREEDVEKYWEWMPIRFYHLMIESRIYYVNVWKSSEDFQKIMYAKVFDIGTTEVTIMPYADREWVIRQFNEEWDLNPMFHPSNEDLFLIFVTWVNSD